MEIFSWTAHVCVSCPALQWKRARVDNWTPHRKIRFSIARRGVRFRHLRKRFPLLVAHRALPAETFGLNVPSFNVDGRQPNQGFFKSHDFDFLYRRWPIRRQLGAPFPFLSRVGRGGLLPIENHQFICTPSARLFETQHGTNTLSLQVMVVVLTSLIRI